MSLLDLLKQYATGSAPSGDAEVGDHFDQAASQSSTQDLGGGIAAAFKSDATPPFSDMVGSLFGRSAPQQQAGMLNELLHGLAPSVLASMAGGALSRWLPAGASGAPAVTPEQASTLSPGQVSEIASYAERHDPSVVDRVGSFYAQHPTLVKTLGAAALGIALRHLGSRR